MTSHLLEKADESLENSSERDVFIEGNKNEDGTSTDQNETDEMTSDEEASPTNDPKTASISTWHDEEIEDKMTDKQKSDGNPTTPKGLTTWSAVNGGGGSYIKGSVQKIPSEYTVSGALSFNGVDRSSTSSVDLVTKERSSTNQPTTEIPRTTKNVQSTSASTSTVPMLNSKRRKPYHKNKKVVQPSKFVKQPLAEITAEAIGTDATHTIYKTKVIDPQTKVAADYAYTTKKPQWPYQLPVKKIVTTKRPMAFSRITAKPKNPYVPKRPLTPMTLSNPTTTTPSTTTTYHRNPAPLMYPFPTISFTNLGLMDFLRSQIIPRIGLSLISFMAASPLILSMIGATAVGRKRRSLDNTQILDTDRVQFEYISNPNIKNLPKFDFSTIKKKLNKLEMIHQKKPRKSIATQVTEIVSKLMKSKAFSMLKSKFLEAHDSSQSPQDSRISRNKSKH
ncbi:uncharacterized protein LOC110844922 [Folsomia candida]|nr:uncharacterized protein LOC110844922 [Folsomia candida]